MFVDSFNEIVRSKYSWLYNNLFLCKTDGTDHGYIIEDKSIYNGYGTAEQGSTWAYWTSTTVDIFNSDSRVWLVSRHGYLGGDDACSTRSGIRPVITIPKFIISK